jgi:hypothetical protein
MIEGVPPPVQLFQMMTGFAVSQAIFVAARLDIAELIGDGGGEAVEDLARRAGVQPGPLYRVLRALASVGVFTEASPRRFANTEMSRLLRAGVPGSQHAGAVMIAVHCYPAFEGLLDSVRTGRAGFETKFGVPLFEHLAKHPDEGGLFDKAMESIHGPETPAMIAAYDFSGFKAICDVGGGNGHTLLQVLRAAPGARGIVFDLPGVVERTGPHIAAAGMAWRCTVEAGSFFERVPAADGYILRHIIHDWDDEKSVAILRRCREAAAPGARVLVVESVIPPGDEAHPGKWLDLVMLSVPGGKERTAGEYEALLKQAGWTLTRIVPTASPVSVVEGVVG